MNDIVYAAQHLPDQGSSPQQPDCWRFFYCTAGNGLYIADSLQFPYGSGSMIVLPPDVHPAHVCQEGTKGILLHICQVSLLFRQPFLMPDDANSSLLHLMQDALWHYQANAANCSPLLSAYGQLLVQHVSLRRPAAPRTQLVDDLAQSILQNYTNPQYELDEILHSAHYCYDYLCRLFRQEMHTTPHKYLTDLRLKHAADMLRAGSSVTEAARQCCYSDPLYFSRMFKKKFGVSPREYAKQA